MTEFFVKNPVTTGWMFFVLCTFVLCIVSLIIAVIDRKPPRQGKDKNSE